jgi:hypothetical protein
MRPSGLEPPRGNLPTRPSTSYTAARCSQERPDRPNNVGSWPQRTYLERVLPRCCHATTPCGSASVRLAGPCVLFVFRAEPTRSGTGRACLAVVSPSSGNWTPVLGVMTGRHAGERARRPRRPVRASRHQSADTRGRTTAPPRRSHQASAAAAAADVAQPLGLKRRVELHGQRQPCATAAPHTSQIAACSGGRPCGG